MCACVYAGAHTQNASAFFNQYSWQVWWYTSIIPAREAKAGGPPVFGSRPASLAQ